MFKAFCSWNHTALREETFSKWSINPDGRSTNILQVDVTRDLFIFMLEETLAAEESVKWKYVHELKTFHKAAETQINVTESRRVQQ